MDRLGMPEDQPIENRMVSRALESAQTKIEGFNFDSRKQILQYDDVLNTQRKAVYERRRALLTGTPEVVEEKLDEVISSAEADTSFTETPQAAGHISDFSAEKSRAPGKNVSAEVPNAIRSIIDKKIADIGRERFLQIVRQLMLQVIDMFWVEHLELMDYARSSVNLRGYGQRDPLVEYKREGLRLFREMQEAINAKILELLPHVGGGVIAQPQPKLREVKNDAQSITGASLPGSNLAAPTAPASDKLSIGRNEPCPCGSGKKWKNCGLKNTEEHQRLMAGK